MRKHKLRTRTVRRSTIDTEIEDFKAFLGPLAEDYTASELRQLRNEMQALADILLSVYVQKKRGELPTIRF